MGGVISTLFGSKENQQQQQQTGGTSQLNLNPHDAALLGGTANALDQAGLRFRAQGGDIANALRGQQVSLGTGFRGAGLNTEFRGPQFSQGLDATSQNLLAQEMQNRAQAGQRVQQNLAQTVGRGNPALARVLGAQSQFQQALANNPLAFQAMTQQGAREMQNYQLGQQAQQATNQARLAQQEQANQALGLGNQALLQQQQGNVAALGQAFGAEQGLQQGTGNLLQNLIQLAQTRGQQQQTGTMSGAGAKQAPGILTGLLG